LRTGTVKINKPEQEIVPAVLFLPRSQISDLNCICAGGGVDKASENQTLSR
jgi:hypothetical protein